MTEFRPGQPANQAHLALKSALETMEKAKRCAVLWFGEILERRLYEDLGYSSINQYAKVELGFSTSRTGDFMQLCRRLKKLPQVKEQVASGKLGYTKARVVASVADEIHQCPDCEKATVQTSKGELEISTAEREQAACDCRINRPGERNTSVIPPATRRRVLVRDRHRCQAPGCSHTRYLEIHHKIPRARGGTNHEDNLTTLCSACHRLRHRIGEPQPIYSWRPGP